VSDDDKTQIAVRGSAIGLGTELNGTYRIDQLIGTGGMGEVFRGHNIQTGDPVAIKIVLPEFARDEMILELFRKEARILNYLSHDAIVRYYVFSIDRTINRPYLAMEFVDGSSLAERVKDKPLTPDDFRSLLKRLADGLHRAHEAGVIHRDMSPDNVILPGGLVANAKIIDFGIARSASVGGGTLLGGSFAGKYNYVSPEQLGLFGGEVTPRSDIYSLALVMAAAMRGAPLDMSGSQVDVIEKRRTIPKLDKIPEEFHPILSAMLQPDPADRPASMAEVRDWSYDSLSEPMRRPEPTPAAAKSKGGKDDRSPSKSAAISRAPQEQPRSNALRNAVIVAAGLAAIGAGVLGGWVYVQDRQGSGGTIASNGGQSPASPPQTAPSQELAKPATDLASKADPKVEPEPKPALEPKPEPKPEVKPAPDALPEPTAISKPPVETRPEPAPEPAPVVTPEPPAEPKPEPPIAAFEPKPVPDAPAPPESTPEPAPTPQPLLQKSEPEKAATESSEPSPAKPSEAGLAALVKGFGAGACFDASIQSLTDSQASITVIGTSETADAFRQAFRSVANFDPVVTLNEPAPAQCTVIAALRGLPAEKAEPLAVGLVKSEIKGNNAETGAVGDPLNVSIKGFGDRNLYLFVMDHNGGIQNINRLCASCISMKAGEMTAALSLFSPPKVEGETPPPFYPMLVFAIASAKPLIGINSQDAFEPADFIEPLTKEAVTAGNVAAKLAFVKLLDQ
jgi:serine/threonine protein kinase